MTNAVKHFKWEPRGKLRIHAKPGSREVAACRPWLEAEVSAVRPRVVVALGATAARSVLGPSFRLLRQRGLVVSSEMAAQVVATVHPASILRAADHETRQRETKRFVSDLKVAAKLLAELELERSSD